MKINYFHSKIGLIFFCMNLLFLLCFFFLLIGPSVAQSNKKVKSQAYNLTLKGMLSHSVNELSVYEMEDLTYYQLLDTRSWEEFKVSHMPGAHWVGYDDFQISRVKDLNLDKEKPVLLYCSVGFRSEKIGEKIKDMGFADVYNLYGGIFEWINAGNLPVDQEGNPTHRVHAYDRIWGVWLKKGEKVYE